VALIAGSSCSSSAAWLMAPSGFLTSCANIGGKAPRAASFHLPRFRLDARQVLQENTAPPAGSCPPAGNARSGAALSTISFATSSPARYRCANSSSAAASTGCEIRQTTSRRRAWQPEDALAGAR